MAGWFWKPSVSVEGEFVLPTPVFWLLLGVEAELVLLATSAVRGRLSAKDVRCGGSGIDACCSHKDKLRQSGPALALKRVSNIDLKLRLGGKAQPVVSTFYCSGARQTNLSQNRLWRCLRVCTVLLDS